MTHNRLLRENTAENSPEINLTRCVRSDNEKWKWAEYTRNRILTLAQMDVIGRPMVTWQNMISKRYRIHIDCIYQANWLRSDIDLIREPEDLDYMYISYLGISVTVRGRCRLVICKDNCLWLHFGVHTIYVSHNRLSAQISCLQSFTGDGFCSNTLKYLNLYVYSNVFVLWKLNALHHKLNLYYKFNLQWLSIVQWLHHTGKGSWENVLEVSSLIRILIRGDTYMVHFGTISF